MENNPIEVENYKEEQSPIDYAVLMKETLTRLQDELNTLSNVLLPVPHMQNLVQTAIDYLFYLEDNRRVIL